MPFRAALVVVFCFALVEAGSAGEFPGGTGTHHLAAVVGSGDKRNEELDSDDAGIVGLEYEYRFSNRWGAGAAIESIDVGNDTNTAILVPLIFRPLDSLRLSFAPGVEFTDAEDLGLFRIAAGYTLPLTDRWFIAPEASVDFTDDNSAFLARIAVGFRF